METFLKVNNQYQKHVLWMYISAYFDKIHSITKKYNLINSVKQNYFLTDEYIVKTLEKIYDYDKKYYVIKRFLSKCIQRHRYSKESYNKTDFLLNNINIETKDVIVINDKKSLKYWLFTTKDIISIFKLALLNRDDFIPEPMIPKNPYNNLDFTNEQLFYIYYKLYKNNFRLPTILYLFDDSNYNIEIFEKLYDRYLLTASTQSYIDNLEYDEFIEILERLSNTILENTICFHNIKDRKDNYKDVVKIFREIIFLFIGYENRLSNLNIDEVRIISIYNLKCIQYPFIIKSHNINGPRRHPNRPFVTARRRLSNMVLCEERNDILSELEEAEWEEVERQNFSGEDR